MKLSQFTKQEQRAVFKEFFKDTPSIRFGDMTEKQLEDIMNTFNGSMIVLRVRFRNFWKEVRSAAEKRKK